MDFLPDLGFVVTPLHATEPSAEPPPQLPADRRITIAALRSKSKAFRASTRSPAAAESAELAPTPAPYTRAASPTAKSSDATPPSALVAHVLDLHLCKIASANGCTYSRYADDITFSTNRSAFPPGIGVPSADDPHVWQVGDDVEEAITHSGFAINLAKTRMQYKRSRQAVTGLVVNRKVNVSADYRRAARIMALRLFATGAF